MKKIQYDLLVFTFKIVQNKLPDWVISLPTVSQHHARETRQAHDLKVPKTRTILADKSLKVKGAKAWNNLPGEIKNIFEPYKYKSRLKVHLMQD